MEEKREFKTDGELYDESLTRKTYVEALELYREIIRRINRSGCVSIYDIVCCICREFPKPKNREYAATHGWTRKSVQGFTVQQIKDGRWCVFLGSPSVLFNEIQEKGWEV